MSQVRLDVRPYHERGEEPFNAIMQAVESLDERGELLLVNSFEPRPLYRVMEHRGFTYHASEVADGEWHVLFRRRA